MTTRAIDRFTSPRRRKDRHARGQGTLLPPTLPVWRTRSEQFDALVRRIVAEMAERFPEIHEIEFAVEDIPPSDPAPWETHDVCLARAFSRDGARGLRDRIVIYRHAVGLRCRREEMSEFLRLLLAERISHILAITPDDLIF